MNFRPGRLSHVLIEEHTGNQIVFLRERDGERTIPMVIGPFEAMAIQRGLRGEPFPRPLTHDLMIGLLDTLGVELRSVRIVKMEGNTFFAELVLLKPDGGMLGIDCRPSDALALLARRPDVELLIADSVLDELDT